MRPNLILVAVVAVTALFGLGAGATWAFVGGLTANLLTTDPLGVIPLGLLLVAGLVALLGRPLGRRPVVLAFLGGLAGSAVLDLADVFVIALQGGSAPGTSMASLILLILPTAMANGILAAAIFLAARAAAGRISSEMPAAWG
jgi:cell shape-determining protein MreD